MSALTPGKDFRMPLIRSSGVSDVASVEAKRSVFIRSNQSSPCSATAALPATSAEIIRADPDNLTTAAVVVVGGFILPIQVESIAFNPQQQEIYLANIGSPDSQIFTFDLTDDSISAGQPTTGGLGAVTPGLEMTGTDLYASITPTGFGPPSLKILDPTDGSLTDPPQSTGQTITTGLSVDGLAYGTANGSEAFFGVTNDSNSRISTLISINRFTGAGTDVGTVFVAGTTDDNFLGIGGLVFGPGVCSYGDCLYGIASFGGAIYSNGNLVSNLEDDLLRFTNLDTSNGGRIEAESLGRVLNGGRNMQGLTACPVFDAQGTQV